MMRQRCGHSIVLCRMLLHVCLRLKLCVGGSGAQITHWPVQAASESSSFLRRRISMRTHQNGGTPPGAPSNSGWIFCAAAVGWGGVADFPCGPRAQCRKLVAYPASQLAARCICITACSMRHVHVSICTGIAPIPSPHHCEY
jgi:hypothetical protein